MSERRDQRGHAEGRGDRSVGVGEQREVEPLRGGELPVGIGRVHAHAHDLRAETFDLGAVVAEETTNSILSVRSRALERLP